MKLPISKVSIKKDRLMINLWKRGLPDWVRKTMWPAIISNKLEITSKLYNTLKK